MCVGSAAWWSLPHASFECSRAGRGESRVWFPNLTRVQYCTCSEMTEYKCKSVGFIFLRPVYAKVHVWGVTMATLWAGRRLGLRSSELPRFGTLDGGRFCHQSWWGQMMSAGPKGHRQLTWNTRLWPLLNSIELCCLVEVVTLRRKNVSSSSCSDILNTSAWLQSNKQSEHNVMLVLDSFH